MLEKLLMNDYGNEQKLNCAQKILFASNEVYHLGLSEDALSLAGGFGGGMGTESTCGVLTAGVMVLSRLFPFNDDVSKKYLYDLNKEYITTFKEHLGGHIDCAPLKEFYRKEDTGCKNIIVEAGKVLDEIIQRELKKSL